MVHAHPIWIAAASFLALGTGAVAQQPEATGPDPVDDTIIVSRESDRAVVKELGQTINRKARKGQPIARFDGPVCVKVAGLPDDMARTIKRRIDRNISRLPGVSVGKEGCKPNAFVGVLNEVNDTVDRLRQDEAWLFEGLLDYQIDRIYEGSEAVRAWHIFSLRNLDRTSIAAALPGVNPDGSISFVQNRVEKASRLPQQRSTLVGAVVLIETDALNGKTQRQVADYATFRILASTSDAVGEERDGLATILTLFTGGTAPSELSGFDRAYLEALYELPANSSDSNLIAAAVSRYIDDIEKPAESGPAG
jgi:hypothetical protein